MMVGMSSFPWERQLVRAPKESPPPKVATTIRRICVSAEKTGGRRKCELAQQGAHSCLSHRGHHSCVSQENQRGRRFAKADELRNAAHLFLLVCGKQRFLKHRIYSPASPASAKGEGRVSLSVDFYCVCVHACVSMCVCVHVAFSLCFTQAVGLHEDNS